MDNAHLLFDNGRYKAANNRSYYAIFHALKAVLALDAFDSKRHSGIISEFQRRYIKDEVFPTAVFRRSKLSPRCSGLVCLPAKMLYLLCIFLNKPCFTR